MATEAIAAAQKYYETELTRLEVMYNTLQYKTKELNKLLNDDNIDKLKKIADIKRDEDVYREINTEHPNIKLINEYLDEIRCDMKAIEADAERKRSFYDKIRRHIHDTCSHMWITDHFENALTMGLSKVVYCNNCGASVDD